MSLGTPRVHRTRTGSTNDDARGLALAGAPHGTLVSAAEQTAGRGREGRRWDAPPGSSLLCSLVLREPPALLSLRAGVAVADTIGELAKLKWPNDVWLDGRKVAGILVEARPRERWAVLGIGINVALALDDLPPDLRASAGTLGLDPSAIEPLLADLLERLGRRLGEPADALLGAWRERDALLGQAVSWSDGQGVGGGIDAQGRLVVETARGTEALDAGEVHLLSSG
jgi:BirA family biotin operon repressor/biotin-[acetyl-CoA-carboxylase] ligase